MQDFNLRPEIMGFGSPIRAETAAPVVPADTWKPHGKSFEVNGLGQLRTVLALPASEAEIAASMRHVDAPPVSFSFKPNPEIQPLVDYINRVQRKMLFGDFSSLETRVEAMTQAAAVMDAQAVPRDDRIVHGFDGCRCDGCNLSRGAGRFSSTEKIMADVPRRNASDIFAEASKNAQAAAFPPGIVERLKSATVPSASYAALQSTLVRVARDSRDAAVIVLNKFGANTLRQVKPEDYRACLDALVAEAAQRSL